MLGEVRDILLKQTHGNYSRLRHPSSRCVHRIVFASQDIAADVRNTQIRSACTIQRLLKNAIREYIHSSSS